MTREHVYTHVLLDDTRTVPDISTLGNITLLLAALRSKSKDWLARNQDNVLKWSDMSTHGMLFQRASNI